MTDPALSPLLAVALGALQGVAEFLPISSSGHLALAQIWFGVDPAAGGHTFSIVVHAGTLLAVLLFYRDDLGALAHALVQRQQVPIVHHVQSPADPPAEPLAIADDLADGPGPRPSPPLDVIPNRVGPPINTARALLLSLLVGTLPLVFALTSRVESMVVGAESDVRWIGGGFLVTAALLAFSHRRSDAGVLEAPRPWQALVIGLAQLVAVLPGISRSGSTMAAAMALGLGRLPAARFSFLLLIPAILGATLKEMLVVLERGGSQVEVGSFVLGFAAAFAVGSLTLRALMRLLVYIGLLPFVPYLLVLGAAVIGFS